MEKLLLSMIVGFVFGYALRRMQDSGMLKDAINFLKSKK